MPSLRQVNCLGTTHAAVPNRLQSAALGGHAVPDSLVAVGRSKSTLLRGNAKLLPGGHVPVVHCETWVFVAGSRAEVCRAAKAYGFAGPTHWLCLLAAVVWDSRSEGQFIIM